MQGLNPQPRDHELHTVATQPVQHPSLRKCFTLEKLRFSSCHHSLVRHSLPNPSLTGVLFPFSTEFVLSGLTSVGSRGFHYMALHILASFSLLPFTSLLLHPDRNTSLYVPELSPWQSLETHELKRKKIVEKGLVN